MAFFYGTFMRRVPHGGPNAKFPTRDRMTRRDRSGARLSFAQTVSGLERNVVPALAVVDTAFFRVARDGLNSHT